MNKAEKLAALEKVFDNINYEALGINTDNRVYMIAPLVLSVAKGNDFTDEHKKILKDFPKLIELLEWVQANRASLSNMTGYHLTPGPNATPEEVASAVLASFKQKLYDEMWEDFGWNYNENPSSI